MSETAPENEGQDIDPADLDDLGELGDEENEDAPEAKPYVAPSEGEYAKLQRRIQRQEERIGRLVGAKGKAPAKGGTAADQALLAQVNGSKDTDDEGSDDGEAARWRGIAVQQAAASQLSAAGFSGTAKQAARLARLIDTADIAPGRDGSFDLEDEIDELKEEYPQLFSTGGGNRGRAPRVRTAPASDAPVKDPSRKASDAMLRQAGYR